MVETKIGYKIFKEHKCEKGNPLLSTAFIGEYSSGFKWFQKNRWHVPNKGCGPFCVYDSSFSAAVDATSANRNRVNKNITYAVYEVEYLRSNEECVWSRNENIEHIDEIRGYGGNFLSVQPLIYLADKVRIKRRMKITETFEVIYDELKEITKGKEEYCGV